MTFTAIIAFLFVSAYMAIGEAISTRTKAYIPSIFVTGLCFLIGYWTIAPKNLVDLSSFGPNFVAVCMSLLLTHMGTLMSVKKLLEQWKAVFVAVIGICGTVLIAMTIGRLIFGYQFVVAVTPPLTGGIVATALMSDALTAKGLTAMAALPVAMFVMHSFIGYPITSWCLKREGARVLDDFRNKESNSKVFEESAASGQIRKKIIPQVPEQYLTYYLMLFKLILVSLLAHWLSGLTHGAVNEYIICLVLGVIFCELGFLEEAALVKAGVFNWLILGLVAYILSKLSILSPAALLHIVLPLLAMIVLGIIGMFITSSITGRFVGYSKEMSFACALTALFGFPADYIITTEVCNTISRSEEENKYITDILLPRMLVGGFATVSIASVIIATIFIKLV